MSLPAVEIRPSFLSLAVTSQVGAHPQQGSGLDRVSLLQAADLVLTGGRDVFSPISSTTLQVPEPNADQVQTQVTEHPFWG